ncbi:GNAT family N-acetyltransferase [Psychrobacillus sp. L3]|uniref:GNAT family N-acetyltransferase n=1 Tax=Psychrobacillus sp. L3 TaxID=3236891 RepID=UPI0036F1CCB3
MKVTDTAKLHLEKLEVIDIPHLIDLSNSVGWDYDQAEIETIMSSGKVYGYKNEIGEIVCSAAIIEYDSKIASIGMVIVRQDYQGVGLGKKATHKCIDSIPNSTTIMLIATEEGKPMYEKMGFSSIDSIQKLICDFYEPCVANGLPNNIKPFNEKDLTSLIQLDIEAFGDNRRTFLTNRIKQSKEALVMKSSDGKVTGYGLSIAGPVNLILGPIVAPDSETALALVNELVKDHHGKFRIDVPSGNEDFIAQLKKCGFSRVSKPPIMIKNSNELPVRNKTLFGIAAQIFG